MGTTAQEYRQLYAVPDDVIVVAREDLAHAAVPILSRRSRGQRTRVRILAPHRRLAAIPLLSEIVLNAETAWEKRAALFDAAAAEQLQINSQPQNVLAAYSALEIQLLKSIVSAADACVFGSWTEAALFAQTLGSRPFRIEIEAFEDLLVPHQLSAAPPCDIAIWAPGKTIQQLGSALAAFHDEPVTVRAICAGGEPPCENVRIVSPHDAAAALARAGVIVDFSFQDPGSAIALAAFGKPIAAAAASGAQEYVDGIAAFDPWSRRSVSHAVQLASTMQPRVRKRPCEDLVPHIERVSQRDKISVIVPTLNKSGLLERTLRSIEAQTHGNVEVIVVNDGGAPLALPGGMRLDIRTESHDQTRGLPAARNTGIRAASGTHVAFLDDDDAYLPDHLANAAALLDCGVEFTYADFALCFISGREDGSFWLHAAQALEQSPQPTDFLGANQIGVLTTVMRRDLALREPFDETLPVCEDYELWLRLQRRGVRFRHTGQMTALYTVRLDKKNMSSSRQGAFVPTYERIYEAYPLPQGSALAQGRLALLDAWRKNSGPFDLQPLSVLEQPIELGAFDGLALC